MTHEQFLGYLIPVFGIMASVAGVLFWRMITKMDRKIDSWFQQHLECRERQQEQLLTRREFRDWRDGWEPGRKELWGRVNKHTHDPSGKVVISE